MRAVLLRIITAAVVAVTVSACTATPSAPTDAGPNSPPPSIDAGANTTAPAPSTRPGATAAAAPPPNCGTAELRASLGQGDGAAGSVIVALLLTNSGPRTCELRGFPGVSYVAGADGHQVGPAAAMAGERGGEVLLRPGAAASALLRLVDVQNFDPASCRPTPVRGLRIYPPGDTTSLFVERAGTGCAATPPGIQMDVRTLTDA